MEILSRILILRLKIVATIVTILIVAIILYLYHLQVNLMPNFFRLSEKNFLRYEKISGPRGNIVDANGNLLATNRPVNTIFWNGTGEKKLTDDQQNILKELVTIFQLPDSIMLDVAKAEKLAQQIPLAYDVSFDQLSRIIEHYPNHKNIFIHRLLKRYYPHKNIASHVVGYLGLDIESSGKMGLELICNESLQGQAGQIIKIINSIGRNLESHQVKKALAGETLKTTLNLNFQVILEELFPDDVSGSCIILSPKTGAIEALVSRPNFDPNIFLNPIDPMAWKELQEKNCFINRALIACYPPASLFKLVTLSAALETNIIEQNTKWYCVGHTNFKDRLYHCARLEGHGVVNTEQALAYSCNIPFFEMGKKIKIDTLADYALRLGLGNKTNILFHEKTGLIPTSQWKKRVKKEAWWPGETLSAAIGQSFILVTPIQIACMVSAICEGYLVQPRILDVEPIIKRPITIKKETLRFLKRCMKSVIKYGTGLHLRNLKDFKIYGKSGTAQTSNLANLELGGKHVPHGWFVAYFKYKNDEPHTLLVLIENAGSSTYATRIAQKFFKRFKILNPSPEFVIKAKLS